MQGIRLLIMAGSARSGSLSLKLANAAGSLARDAGAAVELLDLRALQLPIYDGDLEAASGVPESAGRLQDAIGGADAVLIVTPEYNGFPTPLVINAFDWLSRIPGQGARPSGLAVTASKPVALMASSPGPLGGLRSMNFLRQYLQMAFAMIVVPQQYALGRAHEAFDEQGAFKDEKAQLAATGVMTALATIAGALRATRPAG
jgi:chromate reductase, NAD(P)H dehydrogenase (quinone)